MSLPQFPSVTSAHFQICKSINAHTYIYIFPNYESILKNRRNKVYCSILAQQPAEKHRNTSSTSHGRSTWSQLVVTETGTGKEPAERQCGAGRLGGFAFPPVSISFGPSTVKLTQVFFSPLKHPVQLYHKGNKTWVN